MYENNEGPVLLFDGVCNFCTGFVRFVIKRDAQAVFRFAPLQSLAAERLVAPELLEGDRLASVILVDNGKVYRKSTAALKIVQRLRRLWPLLSVLLIIPRPLRDTVYNWFGRHRYRMFGKRDACFIPDKDISDRFLE